MSLKTIGAVRSLFSALIAPDQGAVGETVKKITKKLYIFSSYTKIVGETSFQPWLPQTRGQLGKPGCPTGKHRRRESKPIVLLAQAALHAPAEVAFAMRSKIYIYNIK